MATHRMCSLVGLVVLGLLVVLVTGGCESSSSKPRHAIEPDYTCPGVVSSTEVAYGDEDSEEMISDEPGENEYEGSMPMGYREPGYSDAMETGISTEEGYNPGRTEDMSDESSETATSITSYGDEQESTEAAEERGLVEEDESTYHDAVWTPVVNEDEETAPSMDEQKAVEEESSETPALSDNADEGSSNTVTPWISGEDETTTDPNLSDTMSDTAEASDDAPVGD